MDRRGGKTRWRRPAKRGLTGLERALARRAVSALVWLALLVSVLAMTRSAVAWEPTSPIELIVPAGSGGGADRLARALQDVGTVHGKVGQPLFVVNKSGGDGAAGLLHMKASANNPHKLLMALSNLFTTPRASHISFSYRELTPVGMLALDDFVLWVNAKAPYLSARDFFDAVRTARDNTFSVAGTGLKQEDQLLTIALQKQLGKKLTYVPFRGGGEVVARLAEGRSSCSLSNPIEAFERWQSGALRPLCVFRSERMPYSKKLPVGQAWSDIPTCRSAGVDVEYRMLRGVFLPNGVSPEAVTYYVDLLRRVRERPEWREFLEAGALEDRFLVGPEFAEWLERADALHESWMRDAGLLAAP